MGKYQALGWGLAFAAFLLWMLAIYMPRDFVDVSEYANNISGSETESDLAGLFGFMF